MRELCVLVPRGVELVPMNVSADHELGRHALDLRIPRAVKLRHDVELTRHLARRHKRNVAHGDPVRLILKLEAAQRLKLLLAVRLEPIHSAVFGMIVVFVLAAVEHDAAYRTDREREVRSFAVRCDVAREKLGAHSARVVVSASDDRRDRAVRDLADELVELDEIVERVGLAEVAVHDKEIEIVPEVGRDVLRLLVIAVHIGDVNAVYAARLFYRAERKALALHIPGAGAVASSLDHAAVHYGVALRLVEDALRNGYLMYASVVVENSASVFVEIAIADPHEARSRLGKVEYYLIIVPDYEHVRLARQKFCHLISPFLRVSRGLSSVFSSCTKPHRHSRAKSARAVRP